MPSQKDALPVGLALFFLAVAIVAAAVLQPGPGALVGEPAVDAFLAAWRTSRLGTYAVDTAFTRQVPSGASLESVGSIVQRPPDRLVVQFGGVNGQLDGHVLLCGTDNAGSYSCTRGAQTGDYGVSVDHELATLESYVRGSHSLYRVSGDSHGCFRLNLALEFPSPPYGISAQFCFDSHTGAPLLTQIVQPEGTDTTRATDVRAEVTDQDLRVPDKPPAATTG